MKHLNVIPRNYFQILSSLRQKKSFEKHPLCAVAISCDFRRLPSNLKLSSRPYFVQSYHLKQENDSFKSSLVLYDSLSETFKKVVSDTSQSDEKNSRGWAWYTCGPTVYDHAHLGHARTYVIMDIFRRLLSHHHTTMCSSNQPPPVFIMNITDVDDKILQRAKELNVSALELASQYEAEFWKDMDALNVLKPTIVTRVTDHIEDAIIPFIESLVRNKLAYILSEDDDKVDSVYFDVQAFETFNLGKGKMNKYGKLAPSAKHTDGFTLENEVSQSYDKKDLRDFVLWKGRAKDKEEMCWESPWGHGRPGWHIECSAMIEYTTQKLLPSHDMAVHAGGVDLKFPHHTNEIAQSEAYRLCMIAEGKIPEKTIMEEWIPHWVHTGHLHIDGRKMSKSLKNFITIRQLLKSFDAESQQGLSAPPDDFRLWCLGLSGSYRDPTTYSDLKMEESRMIREKIVRFLLEGEEWVNLNRKQPQGKWREEEVYLFEATQKFTDSCNHALYGSIDQVKSFDMNGAAFLQAHLTLIESGRNYLKSNLINPGEKQRPVEPMQQLLKALREQLKLVGFTDRTVNAGLNKQGKSSNIKGGEEALIGEFTRFRELIRNVAIDGLKTDDKEALSKILEQCDEIRDIHLPSLGIQLSDNKLDSENGDRISKPSWNFCVPKSASDQMDSSTSAVSTVDISSLSFHDYFRLHPAHQGKYSEFDETGLPIMNADGTIVSNRLSKKLQKKRDKHMKKKSP